jgi:hypothetical protein
LIHTYSVCDAGNLVNEFYFIYSLSAYLFCLSSDESCSELKSRGYDQPLFAKIGKYAIIILAAWNLLREVIKGAMILFDSY